jgi:hypothetical protein
MPTELNLKEQGFLSTSMPFFVAVRGLLGRVLYYRRLADLEFYAMEVSEGIYPIFVGQFGQHQLTYLTIQKDVFACSETVDRYMLERYSKPPIPSIP